MVRLRILPLIRKGRTFVCALCRGAPPAVIKGGDLFACLDDGQTTGQAPTKYELIIQKLQRDLGLGPHHPQTLLARADDALAELGIPT
jgi:hypothetical protein